MWLTFLQNAAIKSVSQSSIKASNEICDAIQVQESLGCEPISLIEGLKPGELHSHSFLINIIEKQVLGSWTSTGEVYLAHLTDSRIILEPHKFHPFVMGLMPKLKEQMGDVFPNNPGLEFYFKKSIENQINNDSNKDYIKYFYYAHIEKFELNHTTLKMGSYITIVFKEYSEHKNIALKAFRITNLNKNIGAIPIIDNRDEYFCIQANNLLKIKHIKNSIIQEQNRVLETHNGRHSNDDILISQEENINNNFGSSVYSDRLYWFFLLLVMTIGLFLGLPKIPLYVIEWLFNIRHYISDVLLIKLIL